MTFTADTILSAGSSTLSLDELALYHAINDLRADRGLAALKPSQDLSIIAGQHATDFNANIGYAQWANVTIASRPIPTLHHWSDGQPFVSGVLRLASGLSLTLPQGIGENAEGVVAGSNRTDVLNSWLDNPATNLNLLSSTWDAMGIGIAGDMVYVTFGRYGETITNTQVTAISGTNAGDLIRSTGWADNISGNYGNDQFVRLTNGDRIDGGAGLDRVTLSGTSADYRFALITDDTGSWAVVSGGAEGEIRLRGVEYVQFTDRTVDSSVWGQPLTSVRFDPDYYARTNIDVANAVASGAIDNVTTHFWGFGKNEGRDPAAFFDTDYYLAQYPDIVKAIANGALPSAFEHFVLYGQFEGRNPNAYFDSADYLALNKDVALAIGNGTVGSAIDHYLTHGRFEGRLATDSFDEKYYLATNPDVAAAVATGQFDSGLTHFRLVGQIEGRAPFDAVDFG